MNVKPSPDAQNYINMSHFLEKFSQISECVISRDDNIRKKRIIALLRGQV